MVIFCGVGTPIGFGQRQETQAACLGREFYVVGVFLNPMGHSDSEEKRILEVLGRGLLEEFPNPARSGAHAQRFSRVSRRMRCFVRKRRSGLIA